jgi:hypothetical protein
MAGSGLIRLRPGHRGFRVRFRSPERKVVRLSCSLTERELECFCCCAGHYRCPGSLPNSGLSLSPAEAMPR